MSTFNIQHHLAAILGQPDRTTPSTAATVLVCLPAHCAADPAALYIEIAQRLTAGLGACAAALCPGHLYTQPHFAPRDRLIINAEPGPGPLRGCAGGPLGLLDFTDSAALITAVAADEYNTWASTVAGTPDAIPLHELVQAFAHDPTAAVSTYCAQPRITAMLAADQRGDTSFSLEDYATLLAAYQAGPAEHRRYLIDLMQLGDALLDLDGTLIAPAPLHQPRLTHSLAQRRHYHDEARRRLRSANPTTVLIACHIIVTPQRSLA